MSRPIEGVTLRPPASSSPPGGARRPGASGLAPRPRPASRGAAALDDAGRRAPGLGEGPHVEGTPTRSIDRMAEAMPRSSSLTQAVAPESLRPRRGGRGTTRSARRAPGRWRPRERGRPRAEVALGGAGPAEGESARRVVGPGVVEGLGELHPGAGDGVAIGDGPDDGFQAAEHGGGEPEAPASGEDEGARGLARRRPCRRPRARARPSGGGRACRGNRRCGPC